MGKTTISTISSWYSDYKINNGTNNTVLEVWTPTLTLGPSCLQLDQQRRVSVSYPVLPSVLNKLTYSYCLYPNCCVSYLPKGAGYNFCGTTTRPMNSQPNTLFDSRINSSTSSLCGWQLQSHNTYGTKRDHLDLVHQNLSEKEVL